jgi:DNA-binding NarL/FixJ family response regulator
MRILVADDHTLFRQGIVLVLANLFEGIEVVEARDVAEAEAGLGGHLDVILLDLAMPGMEGWSGLERVRALAPGTPVAILSATADADVVAEALRRGAAGYIHKSCNDATLHHAVSLMLAGEIYVPARVLRDRWTGAGLAPKGSVASLSPRQRQVLDLMTRGHPNKEIARQLDVLESTVKAHIKVIFDKLGVSNRTQAALKAAGMPFSDRPATET